MLLLLLSLACVTTPAAEPDATPADVELQVVAGAAVAGVAGGALLAVPVLFSVLPLGGPFVAAPVAMAIVGVTAGFGAFLGELLSARLPWAAAVGGTTLVGVVVGASAGAAVAGGLASINQPGSTVFLAALVGGAAGALLGAGATAAGAGHLVDVLTRDGS